MTSDEKFEQWWDTKGWLYGLHGNADKSLARAAWNARLSDEDADTMTPEVIEVMQEALLHHRAKYGDVHRKLCDKGIVILESLKEKL